MSFPILLPKQISSYPQQVGAKTRNLAQLIEKGFNVPPFIAVPCNEVLALCGVNSSPHVRSAGKIIFDKKQLQQLAKMIVNKLPCASYAVRSSALIEDTFEHSYAGQFTTKVAQPPENLATAMYEVLKQAAHYLKGKMGDFSLLIQEYIEPEIAGVTFTRNPLGGREMVIEYHHGRGEELVSGKIKPQRKQFYWQQPTKRFEAEGFDQAFENFKALERLYKWPQDIEWCYKNGIWYILQTRPLTTISAQQYEQNLFLDNQFPAKQHFFWQKTGISESVPRPTPFALNLLTKIYKSNGPVAKVYKKHNIRYVPTNFLHIIGNELYVDMEAELTTLLPCFSYFQNNTLNSQPKAHQLQGLWHSIRNIISLNALQRSVFRSDIKYHELFEQLCLRLAAKVDINQTLQKLVDRFLKDYELIYEINLLAGMSLKQKKEHFRGTPPNSQHIASLIAPFTMVGNSLDIADKSHFRGFQSQHQPSPWLQLREYGRWLTVKNMSLLREKLIDLAKKIQLSKPHYIYFFTLEELQQAKKLKESLALRRYRTYQKYNKYTSPAVLSSIPLEENKTRPLMVSPGSATGMLVSLQQLKENPQWKNVIIYAQSLTPDLTEYFDKVKGIISEQGGLLSHLAIMAREKGLPVMVGVTPLAVQEKMNRVIKIQENGIAVIEPKLIDLIDPNT